MRANNLKNRIERIQKLIPKPSPLEGMKSMSIDELREVMYQIAHRMQKMGKLEQLPMPPPCLKLPEKFIKLLEAT